MHRTGRVKAVIMVATMFLQSVLSLKDDYDNFGWILKCCPDNHIFSRTGCILNKKIKLTVPVYKKYDGLTKRDYSVKVNFVYYKVKCVVQGKRNSILQRQYRIPFEPFFLQTNGNLWVPSVNRTFSNRHFCLEYFEGLGVVAGICPYGVEASKNMTKAAAQDSEIPIDVLVSTPFIFATFVVYALLPERNLFGMCLMSYVFALFWPYFLPSFCYFYGKFAKVNLFTCRIIYMIIYYFIVSSFIWTHAISFDIWLKFSGKKGGSTNEKRRFCKYSIYAWGTPVIFVILVATLANSPSTKWYAPFAKGCWLQEGLPQLLYMYGPMGICLAMNIFFFVSTAWRIIKTRKETRMLRESGITTHNVENEAIGRFMYVKLMFFMGIEWTVDLTLFLLQLQSKPVELLVFMTKFWNGVVGVFIFFLFVCNKTNWRLLKKRYCMVTGKMEPSQQRYITRGTSATANTNC